MTLKWKERGNYRLPEYMSYSTNGGGSWQSNALDRPLNKYKSAYQITGSEGHVHLSNNKWSGGGPFYTGRVYTDFPSRHILWQHPEVPNWIVDARIGTPMPDAMLPSPYNGFNPKQVRSENTSDLDKDGAVAVGIVAPTNPAAELSLLLAEAKREGMPALPALRLLKKRAEFFKSLGSEFLNVEFGWIPFLKDVHDLADSIRGFRDMYEAHRLGEGKPIHKDFSWDDVEHETQKEFPQGGAPSIIMAGNTEFPLGNNILSSPMDLTQSIKVKTRKWFTGTFTYKLPGDDTLKKFLGYGSDADKLFGTSLTPDVLWELTPWSWLVDWFSNTGMIINNFTQFELNGLVMPYAYMMEEKTIEITHTMKPQAKNIGKKGYIQSVPPSKKIINTKVRRPANPFGFGVELNMLSPVQIAILVALGITLA